MDETKLNNIFNNFIRFSNMDFKAKQQYIDIYSDYDNKIKPYFIYFHQELDELLRYMNDRVSNGHYNANESRELICIIEQINELQSILKNTNYSFYLDEDYKKCIDYCYTFLSTSGGSEIPKEYKKIILKRYEPIFKINESLIINKQKSLEKVKLKLKGNGAYANVYTFEEPLTNKKFAMKKLKKDIEEKELQRFKLEFEKMNSISNPYILKAYTFNEEENSYIMEYCDYTLRDYILSNNNKNFMDFQYRKNIALQFLKGLKYLHSKGMYHRDISFNNILIKEFDDNFVIIKISDFGLLKDLNLELTRTDSEIRGTIIDDTLTSFKDYDIKNEIYAIGVVLWFIFTGRTNLKLDDSKVAKIVNKCITRELDRRYNNVDEIIQEIRLISDNNTEIKTINVQKNKEYFKVEKIKNKNGLNIDDRAFTILKSMIEDDGNNQLYYLKTLSGEILQTSGGNFNISLEEYTAKERAYWKKALQDLIDNNLIKSLDYKNEIFEVTTNGYEFYDLQKDETFVAQTF